MFLRSGKLKNAFFMYRYDHPIPLHHKTHARILLLFRKFRRCDGFVRTEVGGLGEAPMRHLWRWGWCELRKRNHCTGINNPQCDAIAELSLVLTCQQCDMAVAKYLGHREPGRRDVPRCTCPSTTPHPQKTNGITESSSSSHLHGATCQVWRDKMSMKSHRVVTVTLLLVTGQLCLWPSSDVISSCSRQWPLFPLTREENFLLTAQDVMKIKMNH